MPLLTPQAEYFRWTVEQPFNTFRKMSNNHSNVFQEIVDYRRSVRKYVEDPNLPQAVERSLQRAVLAPNSSNMQLWEFYRIQSPEKRAELATYCLNQNAAKTAQELVVVVVRGDLWRQRAAFNLEKIKEQLKLTPDRPAIGGSPLLYYGKLIPMLYWNDPFGIAGCLRTIMQFFVGLTKPTVRDVSRNDMRIVTHKSAALAAQTFMLSMAAEGFDTCPMEGFDSHRVRKMLKLPNRAEINMVISTGKRAEDGIYNTRWRVPFEDVVKYV